MTYHADSLAHEANDHSYLNVMQALLWAIFFLPYYVIRGLELMIPPSAIGEWEPILFPIGMWFFFLSWIIFSQTMAYVLVSAMVILSGVAAFAWGDKGRFARICALLGALSVMALPWLFPYQPALHAAPGVMMQVVTQPANPVLGIVKMAQSVSEEVPCEYHLLGWNAENQLYYRSQCEAEEQTWLVDPNQPHHSMSTTALPNDLWQKPSQQEQKALREQLLEMLRANGVRPEGSERSARELYLREGSLRSPNGQWFAIKSSYVYGPRDVVLIKAP